ncbi:MAG: autotransporter domain-containing protein, partial [Gammaproteobacteria bacterium]|nr:autotransporter domain-containing protein [Gammaproteobacteria bacterium]
AEYTYYAPVVSVDTEITLTLEVKDSKGLTSEDTVTITVSKETIAPEISAPDDQLLNTDEGKRTASLDVTKLGASATDSSGETLNLVHTIDVDGQPMELDGSYDFPLGETIVTITATDSAGNLARITFKVVVKDNESPVITTPSIDADEVVLNVDQGKSTASFDISTVGKATDSVDGELEIVYTIKDPTDADKIVTLDGMYNFPIGSTEVKLTAEDSSGNKVTTTINVKVLDNLGPVVTPPKNVVVDILPGEDTASVDVTELDYSATDNSGGEVTIVFSIKDSDPTIVLNGPYDFGPGVTTILLTATDASGNSTTVEFTITANIVAADDPTPEIIRKAQLDIGEMMLVRNTQLAQHQTGLVERYSRMTKPDYRLNGWGAGDELKLDFNYTTGENDLWLDSVGSISHSDGLKSDYALLTLGKDFWISDRAFVGPIVEFDYINSQDEDKEVSGTGMLIGGYAAIKHPDQQLYIEGRILKGSSDNSYTPVGGAEESFKTDRMVAKIEVSGGLQDLNNSRWMASPNISVTYVEDEMNEFTNTNGVAITSFKTSLVQVDVGLNVEYSLNDATLLTGGFSASHNKSEATGYASELKPESDGSSLRFDIGVERKFSENGTVKFGTYYGGALNEDYEDYGVNFELNLKF